MTAIYIPVNRTKPVVIHRKKQKKTFARSCSEKGKGKGVRCTAKPELKVMCKRNRSWKWKTYPNLVAELDKKANAGSGGKLAVRK